jgi:anti-sigma regulatory factor (Ser/Thr protein kinase)
MAHCELETSSDLRELARICAFVRKFCQEVQPHRLDEEAVVKIELAVNEAASNIMKHAYGGRPDRRILVRLEALPDQILIQLCHSGASFDPPPVREPEPETSGEGGLGLYIISWCVDEVLYSRDPEGRNCICLVKRLHHDPGEGR